MRSAASGHGGGWQEPRQFAAHDASGVAADRARALDAAAKALLGEDFVVVPDFAERRAGDELTNALAASRSGTLFDHLVHPPIGEAPDRLSSRYVASRRRARPANGSCLGTGDYPDGRVRSNGASLDALQLPHVPGDRWIGLDFPADQKLDADRLLYTAHFAEPFDASRPLCGLLLDEWTETIPASQHDTGIALHYDRPNAEASQTMLLLTPSQFRGAWQWDDVVDAVNEALDMAKRRAIEPAHIDKLPIASFLPATIMATQVQQLTIAANLALNNQFVRSED